MEKQVFRSKDLKVKIKVDIKGHLPRCEGSFQGRKLDENLLSGFFDIIMSTVASLMSGVILKRSRIKSVLSSFVY